MSGFVIKQAPDKRFAHKMDFIQFLKENQSELIRLKRLEMKSDKDSSQFMFQNKSMLDFTPKINVTSDIILVKTAINTTNVIDSHLDLHLPKIWNKTVTDNPTTLHLESHTREFNKLLDANAKQYNEKFKFSDYGIATDIVGQANINEAVIKRKDNPVMFDAYVDGKVKMHSVGMLYVSLSFLYADEDDPVMMANYNEYRSKAINPEVADEYGYFWGIHEAKKLEGSPVVLASNPYTPTIWVKDYKPSETDTSNKNEPSNDTQTKNTPLFNLF